MCKRGRSLTNCEAISLHIFNTSWRTEKMNDRITHAHQTRTQIHAYILANEGASLAQISDNNTNIGRDSVRSCIRYLKELLNIRKDGLGTKARFYTLTPNIRPLAEIREKMRINGVRNPPISKAMHIIGGPGSTVNEGGSLMSSNQGGQGAVRHEIRRGCSMP